MRVMSQSKNDFELAHLGKFCYELQDTNKAYKIYIKNEEYYFYPHTYTNHHITITSSTILFIVYTRLLNLLLSFWICLCFACLVRQTLQHSCRVWCARQCVANPHWSAFM